MINISRKRNISRRGGGIVTSALSTLGKVFNKVPVGPIVNTVIDALPIELHIPGYQYCGPGTKLSERLSRGDSGINKLDQACKEHDIAYSKYSDSSNRTAADKALAQKAWDRVKSGDASLGEKAAALAVTAAMKAKTTISGGGKRRRVRKRKQRNLKYGGNINRQRKINKKKVKSNVSKKKNFFQGNWKMIKSGKGLYLRPYRNV